MPVSGNENTVIEETDKQDILEWARHFHWTDNHRVCAICGKYVKGNDLELAINDGSIKIDPDYTDEYEKPDKENPYGKLLVIHEYCIKAK